MKKNILQRLYALRSRAFVMPLTLVVCVIILTISTGISIILTKELYFSKLSRLSQVAYYAADNGLMCATMVDDQYLDPVTGLGIFQYADTPTSQSVLDGINASRTAQGLNTINLTDIKCATSAVFDSVSTGFTVVPFTRIDSAGNSDSGKATTFNMRMDLGSGEYRCATVLINKTPTYRQIISRGFASCDSVYAYPIERAIVSTSETSGGVAAAAQVAGQREYTVPGTYLWTAPEGVTSVSVVAVGAGGAGGSAKAAGGGGGGGGLGYKNSITVVPGNTYTVVVGSGGVGVTALPADGGTGGDGGSSYFISLATVSGTGGGGGKGTTGNGNGSQNGGVGGSFVGDGGGAGGIGDRGQSGVAGGGGGAGGYTGAGGAGNGASGTGGGAAGGLDGGNNSTLGGAQSGGGVGIYGLGTSGTTPGAGGSGGSNGSPNNSSCSGANTGGLFGGGGGGQNNDAGNTQACSGGSGAVRIIWPGNTRLFPSTQATNQ